jgi:hypothetical protein
VRSSRAIAILLVLLAAAGCQATPVTPLPRAHAHNDYRHVRPLLDALDAGFCSVEADVHLVDRKLLVGHAIEETSPDRTLQSLYLDPLRDRIKRNGGCVYPAKRDQRLTLMIDIKTEGGPTYEALRDALLPYRDILTMTFLDGTINPRPVTVLLTGRVPRPWIAREPVRFVACDGILEDLAITPPPAVDLVPQVNAKWDALFTWRGEGEIPPDEKRELRRLVNRAPRAASRHPLLGRTGQPRRRGRCCSTAAWTGSTPTICRDCGGSCYRGRRRSWR